MRTGEQHMTWLDNLLNFVSPDSGQSFQHREDGSLDVTRLLSEYGKTPKELGTHFPSKLVDFFKTHPINKASPQLLATITQNPEAMPLFSSAMPAGYSEKVLATLGPEAADFFVDCQRWYTELQAKMALLRFVLLTKHRN